MNDPSTGSGRTKKLYFPSNIKGPKSKGRKRFSETLAPINRGQGDRQGTEPLPLLERMLRPTRGEREPTRGSPTGGSKDPHYICWSGCSDLPVESGSPQGAPLLAGLKTRTTSVGADAPTYPQSGCSDLPVESGSPPGAPLLAGLKTRTTSVGVDAPTYPWRAGAHKGLPYWRV
jgi:hypothetical protein